jgi:hypothetical protein
MGHGARGMGHPPTHPPTPRTLAMLSRSVHLSAGPPFLASVSPARKAPPSRAWRLVSLMPRSSSQGAIPTLYCDSQPDSSLISKPPPTTHLAGAHPPLLALGRHRRQRRRCQLALARRMGVRHLHPLVPLALARRVGVRHLHPLVPLALARRVGVRHLHPLVQLALARCVGVRHRHPRCQLALARCVGVPHLA